MTAVNQTKPQGPSSDTADGLEEAHNYLRDEIKLAFPGSGHKVALIAISQVVRREISRLREKERRG